MYDHFFVLIPSNLLCVDNIRRIYILINWLGLKGLLSSEQVGGGGGSF